MNKKRENFKKISFSRRVKINDMISKLAHFKNKQFYEYDKEDIEALIKDIRETLDRTEAILLDEFKIIK